ncbi:putative nad-dependent 15-hydroxyprostaglandin dehydrogenase [Diplodia seriata]|uniref:Putative nad-dependent 15-hydroxyprostaglandin dehydrogenase n=1 Tax=Diplodia seriata TaxID=420778 RepID=A0A0G2G7Y8_9PEZI|nr:putative nad-dependent 15-hydroxyprostaglandin dehydrogenase [Diplodia seriata]
MSQSVRGKTALVTGAGSGINLAFATLLLTKGCNVIFADLALRPEAQRVVDNHSSSPTTTITINPNHGLAVFVKTDVRSWPQLERAFAAADHHFPGSPLTIVCPGAGVYEPASSSFWRPPGTTGSGDDPGAPSRYALLDINVVHPIRTAQLALERWLMRRNNNNNNNEAETPDAPKSLILVSSTSAQATSLATPLYDASKHAVSGFVRALRDVGAVGVRVAAVAPGLVRTPLYTDDAEKLAMVDESRDVWVEPAEVAEVMCALVERDGMSGGSVAGEEDDIKIEGGIVVEVTKGKARVVRPYHDPGPSGPGTAASNMAEVEGRIQTMLRNGWGC